MIINLSADAQAGSKTLRTKHDPVQMGWQVGDRIAIAKTTGSDRGQHVEITGISSFKIDIKDRVTDTVRFQPIEITSFPIGRLIPYRIHYEMFIGEAIATLKAIMLKWLLKL